MSEQAITCRLAAGLAIILAAGLSGPAMAQVPEDAGPASLQGGALTPEEIEQLRSMADLPAGEDAGGDVSQLIAQLGLAPVAEEAETEIDHVVRGAALIGYVPQGGHVSEPLRRPGEPLEGENREVLRGEATALAGDRFSIDGRELRLQGVRAPGGDDQCITGEGMPFDCSDWATRTTAGIIEGKEMACAITETKDNDGFPIGWCEITLGENDVRDFGHMAVRAGLLLSSDTAGGVSFYRAEQTEAERQQAGLWSARFIPGCQASGVCTE